MPHHAHCLLEGTLTRQRQPQPVSNCDDTSKPLRCLDLPITLATVTFSNTSISYNVFAFHTNSKHVHFNFLNQVSFICNYICKEIF